MDRVVDLSRGDLWKLGSKLQTDGITPTPYRVYTHGTAGVLLCELLETVEYGRIARYQIKGKARNEDQAREWLAGETIDIIKIDWNTEEHDEPVTTNANGSKRAANARTIQRRGV